MTFGYEIEFFVQDGQGRTLWEAPSFLPRDGGGVIVEARSGHYSNIDSTAASAHDEIVRIKKLALSHGFSLICKDSEVYDGEDVETAGFHVHFGDSTQLDMPYIIAAFDSIFAKEIANAYRKPSAYRMKRYGFEYRSLPATTQIVEVTKVIRGLDLERD